MGFFGDLWHGFTQTITAPVTSFVGFGGAVISGENLGAAIKTDIAKTVSGSLGVSNVTEKAIGLPQFEDKISPITLGITGDLAHEERFTDAVNQGHNPDQREINVAIGGAGDAYLKAGAIYATGSLAYGAAEAGYGAELLAGAGAASQFARGNVAGGVASLVGGFGDQLPFDATPILDAIGNQGGKAPTSGPLRPGPGSQVPLFGGAGFDPGLGTGAITWTTVAIGAGALFLIIRGSRK